MDSRLRYSGLKSDAFQICYSGLVAIESLFPGRKGKELRKRSAFVRGVLVEWKDKVARPGTKLKVFRIVLAHIFLILLGSNRIADCQGITYVRALSAIEVTPPESQRAYGDLNFLRESLRLFVSMHGILHMNWIG